MGSWLQSNIRACSGKIRRQPRTAQNSIEAGVLQEEIKAMIIAFRNCLKTSSACLGMDGRLVLNSVTVF